MEAWKPTATAIFMVALVAYFTGGEVVMALTPEGIAMGVL